MNIFISRIGVMDGLNEISFIKWNYPRMSTGLYTGMKKVVQKKVSSLLKGALLTNPWPSLGFEKLIFLFQKTL
jgi:hypothetical protein